MSEKRWLAVNNKFQADQFCEKHTSTSGLIMVEQGNTCHIAINQRASEAVSIPVTRTGKQNDAMITHDILSVLSRKVCEW